MVEWKTVKARRYRDEGAHVRNCNARKKRKIMITLPTLALFAYSFHREGDDDDDA